MKIVIAVTGGSSNPTHPLYYNRDTAHCCCSLQ